MEDLSTPTAQQRHYSVAEIAALWSLSSDAVRRVFEREPGVLLIGSDGRDGKRRYRTLRIPEAVMERVHRRLSNPDLSLVTQKREKVYSARSRDRRPLRAAGAPDQIQPV